MASLSPDGGVNGIIAQAGLSPRLRIIPAHSVAAMEQAASDAAAAGESLRAARARCDEQLADVLQSAHLEGVTAAHTDATQRLLSFLDRVEQATCDVEQQLVTLIVDAVEKIIGARSPQECMHDLALQALVEARTLQGRITLTVHPDVAPDTERLLACLEKAHVDVSRLHIETDPALGVRACRLSSAAGDIDASLDVQLAALTRALLDQGDA